jgi:hypothetical protein
VAIDGTYNTEMTTPRGTTTGQIIIKESGNTVSGVYKTQRGDQNFNGTLEGTTASWTINIAGPMGSMALGFKVTFTGNALSGTVQMGQFGAAPIKGTKAA